MNSIARWRLENQHLVAPTLSDPVVVVRALGAVQSQDLLSRRGEPSPAVQAVASLIRAPRAGRARARSHVVPNAMTARLGLSRAALGNRLRQACVVEVYVGLRDTIQTPYNRYVI